MTSSFQPFPSGSVCRLRGRAVPLVGGDIDTDRIIPARFLKCVTFEGLAGGVFADDRAERAHGHPDGPHPFDRPDHQGASLLVVNGNFGCGSSREHAPQALMRWGIRALIGESFAEIFFGNCLALGLPCVSADPKIVQAIQNIVTKNPDVKLILDLESMEVVISSLSAAPEAWPIFLEPGPLAMLKSGQWDATSQLLSHRVNLQETVGRLPYIDGFSS